VNVYENDCPPVEEPVPVPEINSENIAFDSQSKDEDDELQPPRKKIKNYWGDETQKYEAEEDDVLSRQNESEQEDGRTN
jgi:hypothetical protein